MEFTLRVVFAALLVATTAMFCTTSAAPAKTKRSGISSGITDDQIERLRNLLARLRAEHGETTEAPVEKPPNPEMVKDLPKEQEKAQEQEKLTDSAARNSHRPRFVSAEDMRAKGTDIVEELRRLDKDDTVEILARALSKLKKEASDSGEKVESQEKEEEEEADSNSAGDDMGTSNNVEDLQTSKSSKETKPGDTTQLIEALLKEGLADLDRDSGNKPQPMFHKESRMPPQRNKGPVKEPLDQQIEQYLNLIRAGDNKDEESQEESTAEERLREKDLQIIESRLMQDIHLANQLGVSVEDLIRDLEERAYIEANAEKIGELLDMNEHGRDEK